MKEFHSDSQHNSGARPGQRGWACPYCTCGSIRVPDAVFEKGFSECYEYVKREDAKKSIMVDDVELMLVG